MANPSRDGRGDSIDDEAKQLPATSDSDSVSTASFQNIHTATARPGSGRQGSIRPKDNSNSNSNNTNNNTTASPSKNVDDADGPDAQSSPGEPDTTTPAAASPPTNTHRSQMKHTAPEDQRTKLQTTLIVVALCSAVLLAALDVTITTVAIPTISNDFQSSSGYIWIGSAYLLANAAAAPSWGKLSDIFGRKPVLLTAVGIFWVGSLLCGLSVTMGMLIAGRVVQGVGGGGSLILVNICISDLFSVRKRGVYLGFVGLVWALAGGFGPGESMFLSLFFLFPPPKHLPPPFFFFQKLITHKCILCADHMTLPYQSSRWRLYHQGDVEMVLLRQPPRLRSGLCRSLLHPEPAQSQDAHQARADGR